MVLIETNPSVVRKQRLRKIANKKGLCITCIRKSGGNMYAGENEGLRSRRPVKSWKGKRKTKYKEARQ